MSEYLDVVAAVIHRQDGAILLAERASHQHQGGKWEFPGGKVETGEKLLAALARELLEELGIRCNLARPLMTVAHDYDDKSVRLHFFEVDDWVGAAQGLEGQRIDWVLPEQLAGYDFPAANQSLVTALTLGNQLLIWPEETPAFWELRLHMALQRGVSLVYARGVADQDLLAKIAEICHHHQARLLVAKDAQLMTAVAADGLHLTAAHAASLGERPEVPLLSVACHSAAELEQARRLQADLVLLSPVHQTASHPEAEPLGWQAFADLALGLPMPVFALGGVGPGDLPQARGKGAFGVAGISGFWPPEQLIH